MSYAPNPPCHLGPLACLLSTLCLALTVGCGGAPEAAPETPRPETPRPDTPPEAPDETAPEPLDGAKPGEHGCGSCGVRACVAGGVISGLRVELKLETGLKAVRYDKAILRIAPARGGGEAFPLDAAKLAPGVRSVQLIAGEKLTRLRSPTDIKAASGTLMLYWSGPDGPGGQQLPLAVTTGACP